MVDIHCHLDDQRYDNRREEVVERAEGEGIIMISNSTGITSSDANLKLAVTYKSVFAAVGMHPEEVTNFNPEIIKQIKKLTRHKKVVAIGEIGLDFREGITEDLKKKQIELFEAQLQLAQDTQLPAIIHNRRANDEIWDVVKNFKLTVVMHGFSQTVEFMERCIENGWYISIGGFVTYKEPKRLQEVARSAPMDRILLETDAPYAAPEPVRGSINEPKNVTIVAERVADLRNMEVKKLTDQTTINTRRVFKKLDNNYAD